MDILMWAADIPYKDTTVRAEYTDDHKFECDNDDVMKAYDTATFLPETYARVLNTAFGRVLVERDNPSSVAALVVSVLSNSVPEGLGTVKFYGSGYLDPNTDEMPEDAMDYVKDSIKMVDALPESKFGFARPADIANKALAEVRESSDPSERLRSLLRHVGPESTLLSVLLKGDVAGHEFHGNQWTGGGGSEGAAHFVDQNGVKSMITEPVSFLKDEPAPKDYASITAIAPERMTQLAAAYDAAPHDDPAAHEAYKALTQEVEQQYKDLTGRLGVKVDFVKTDPYKNVEELRKDLEENHHLAVLKTETTVGSSGAHPYFTNEQNDMFRAVHDAFGHAATGRGFDRNGEEAAYQAHRSMFSDLAGKALATETRSQNSYLITRGDFPEQKVALMPDALIKRLRAALAKAKALITADDDNLYDEGHCHHTSLGRHFKR